MITNYIILGFIFLLIILFLMQEAKTRAYWKGRSDGWSTCEDMVYNRIKKNYPNELHYNKLIEDLLQ